MDKEALDGFVVGRLMDFRARNDRTATFLRFREGDLTFGEVHDTASRLARGLADLGIGKGYHVAVMLANTPDFVPVMISLARLGALAVPVNTAYHGEMLRHILSSSDAQALIIDGQYLDRLAPFVARLPKLEGVVVRTDSAAVPWDKLGKPAVPLSSLLAHGDDAPDARVRFGDPLAIMYTSGTTGPSKGALCSHALALTCALDSLDFLDRWGKPVYCPLPMFHAAGFWDGVLSTLLGGGPLAVVERFSASRFWDDVRHFGSRVCLSVFSMIPILLSRDPDPRDKEHSLESFYMGKSILDAPMRERFGVRAVETYTSTEVGIATASPFGQWRHGSCGQAHEKRFEVAVVDDHDRMVTPGEAGEIVVRPRQPHTITAGYYGAPQETARCFRNLWYHTGDRVWRDSDGYFYFLDRMKDCIRRRGENISAFDLECEVNLHPAVIECAAIGVPSPLEDEDIKLVVVAQPGEHLAESELVTFCQQRLPLFMVPRYVELVDDLPRTPTGKVAKYRLRAEGNHGITPSTWDCQSAATAGADLAVPAGGRREPA